MGKDSKINNLFHNLGSGQAMKYTPILGEALAEDIIGEKNVLKNLITKSLTLIDLVMII